MSTSTSAVLLRPARGLPAYLHHLLRISTVQICRESGYSQSSHAALDTLTSLLQQLVRELGLTARRHAELSGRASANLVDLLSALDDYQCDVHTLLDYHSHSDQLPFPRTLPAFPAQRPVLRVEPAGDGDGGGEGRPAHVPGYLPRWPEERTYRRTEVKGSTEMSNTDKRHRRMEQNRAVEQALLRIQQAERQPSADAAESAIAPAAKRPRTDDFSHHATDRHLTDPSTHQPSPAPPPPFPHSERDRERTLAKNPYLAPLAPPQPQPQPATEADGGSSEVAGSGGGEGARQAGWSEDVEVDIGDTFAANPPPPRLSGVGTGGGAGAGGLSRSSQPAAPPPITDDVDIEI